MKVTRSASIISYKQVYKDSSKPTKKGKRINKYGLDKRQAKAQGYNSGEWSTLENYLYK